VTIAQELLARRAEGALAVEIDRLVLMNGGLYPDLHRPQAVQQALLDSGQALALADGFTEEGFVAFLTPTFPARLRRSPPTAPRSSPPASAVASPWAD